MSSKTPYVLLAIGALLLLFGSYWGLAVAPAEQYMGQVQRIMYVHVPTAWNWMLAILFAFGCAIAFLFTSNLKWDSRMEAGVRTGMPLASAKACTGEGLSSWPRPRGAGGWQ